MWTFSEFRSCRKHPICKKRTLKKVKNGNNNGVVDQSQIKEKNTSASNLLLDSDTKSILWTIDEEEEQIEESGSINGTNIVLLHKPDILPCESVHKKMHQDSQIDGITCRKKEDEDVRFTTLNAIVDDGSNEPVSEDIEYEEEYTTESTSSRGTSDYFAESNSVTARPLESSEDEKLSSANSYSNDDDNVSIRKDELGSMSNDQMMVQPYRAVRQI